MEIAALSAVVLAIGLVSGYEWGKKAENKRHECLMMLDDYDMSNPINANGHRGEIVNICGRDWVRMN